MVQPTYTIQVDWDNDGTFTQTGDDITSRVLNRTPISIAYGRDQARSLAPVSPGRVQSLEVDNRSRDYSPENGSSPLAGHLRPGRPIQIAADGTNLFRGFLDGYDVIPDPQIRAVSLTALDALARLSGVSVSTPLYRGIRTGTAINNLLDAVGWPSAARDLDVGATNLAYWWVEGDAWDALNDVLLAEGPSAMAYVDVDGNFVYRDRHHRLLRTVSKTAQATFRDAGVEPKFSAPMVYDAGWRDIQNSITINVEERAASTASQIVWQSDQWYGVTAGATREIQAVTSDPFLDASVETTTGSGTGFATLGRTSGQSTVITLQNPTGATLTYRSIQLRARPVTVVRTQQVTDEDTTSITEYGRRTPGQDIPWVTLGDAQAIAALIIAQRGERVPTVSLRIVSANSTRLTQQLTRDLSDRVHVVDSETGMADDCFIEQIQHTLDPARRVLETLFGMEKVAGQLDDPTAIFVLNSATNGVLGTNRLAH
jgi:hypothetical protein